MRYEYINETKTWNEADEYCKELGGYLVSITSQIVNDKLLDIMRDIPVKQLWIGYSDQEKENRWIWSNPGAVNNEFTKWRSSSDEPNGRKRENCAVLIKSHVGIWNDLFCGSLLNSICEFS